MNIYYSCLQAQCKFGVVQCKFPSQNGQQDLICLWRVSKLCLLINQYNNFYHTIIYTLAQSLCGYRFVVCTCAAPMCCYRVCVQGVHSTGHLQHPTKELAIRVTNLYTPPHQNGLREDNQAIHTTKGPKLRISATSTTAEYRCIRKPKGKNW